MRQLTATILLMVALTSTTYADGPKCQKVFAESVVFSKEEIDTNIRDLAALRLELDFKKANGLRAVALTALEADYFKKEAALVRNLLGNKSLSRDEYIQRFKDEIQRLQQVKQNLQKEADKDKAEKKEQEERAREVIENAYTFVDGSKLIFSHIKPGEFEMGEESVKVHLTRPFDMAATVTTQVVYQAVAELANSKLNGNYNIDPLPSKKRGALKPVTDLGYHEVIKWIQALNELSALGEPELIKVIPKHKAGDVYRLPTEAEWEFVVRGRGMLNDFFWENSLGDYAWYAGNTAPHYEVQKVATKLPLQIENAEIFDMLGNVHEMVQDAYSENLPGGTDPVVKVTGDQDVVLRGGSVYDRGVSNISRERYKAMHAERASFRMVREVKP